MRAVQHIIIQNEEADQRLDRFLKENSLRLSKVKLKKFVEKVK